MKKISTGIKAKVFGMGHVTALAAVMAMALTTGCASGGFQLTRQYAGFVNRQPTILGAVIYILTIPVFVVTLIIDMVYFNTMDFWSGKVSAGTYEFNKDGKVFQVVHEDLPSKLKRS